MLQFSRRTILKLSVVAILLLTRVKMTLATPLNFPFEENKPLQGNLTLRALLDTLIPADETPSALEVGVLEKITEKAAAEPQYERMIRDGCLWLDMKAREQGSSSFANLAESDRDAVLVRAASASRNSPAYLFFASIRYEAFYYYYGEPATWNMLNYPGPPQPDGFRDYVLPPTRKFL